MEDNNAATNPEPTMNAYQIINAIAEETQAAFPEVKVVARQTGIWFDVYSEGRSAVAAEAKAFATAIALDKHADRKFVHAKSRGARTWWTDSAVRLRRGITIKLTEQENNARLLGPYAFRNV